MSAVADKLRKAKALIERGWTQGAFARRANGRVIGYESDDASCFCIAGALMRVTPLISDFERLCHPLTRATGSPRLDHWNDAPGRTQAEVLAAFDKAIELAEGGQ
jgi:hypothetical protein